MTYWNDNAIGPTAKNEKIASGAYISYIYKSLYNTGFLPKRSQKARQKTGKTMACLFRNGKQSKPLARNEVICWKYKHNYNGLFGAGKTQSGK
jgi:hypothetical protein